MESDWSPFVKGLDTLEFSAHKIALYTETNQLNTTFKGKVLYCLFYVLTCCQRFFSRITPNAAHNRFIISSRSGSMNHCIVSSSQGNDGLPVMLGSIWEYTLNMTPVHHSAPCTQTYLPTDQFRQAAHSHVFGKWQKTKGSAGYNKTMFSFLENQAL